MRKPARCPSTNPLTENVRCGLPKGHKGRHKADGEELKKEVGKLLRKVGLK